MIVVDRDGEQQGLDGMDEGVVEKVCLRKKEERGRTL
jgi:hypothetical protein